MPPPSPRHFYGSRCKRAGHHGVPPRKIFSQHSRCFPALRLPQRQDWANVAEGERQTARRHGCTWLLADPHGKKSLRVGVAFIAFGLSPRVSVCVPGPGQTWASKLPQHLLGPLPWTLRSESGHAAPAVDSAAAATMSRRAYPRNTGPYCAEALRALGMECMKPPLMKQSA
jgi:hypothetical protein